jgi:hypothetical protein
MNLSWNASAAFAFHTYSSAFSDLVKLRMDAMFKLSEATASPAELEEAYELILASGQGLQVAALRVGRDIAFGMATDGSLRLFFRAFGPLARLFGKVPGGSWLYGVGQRFFRTVASKGLQSGQKLVGGARRIGGWAWTKVKNLLPRPGKATSGGELPIKGFHGSKGPNPYHAIHRAIQRGVSPKAILETVKNPAVVAQQGGGRTLYLTPDAAVVLDSSGQVVTVWGGAQHTAKTLGLLRAAGAIK